MGDVVNPMARPAGVLIATASFRPSLQAGFGQIEGQVMKPGMLAEVTCIGVTRRIHHPIIFGNHVEFNVAEPGAPAVLSDTEN